MAVGAQIKRVGIFKIFCLSCFLTTSFFAYVPVAQAESTEEHEKRSHAVTRLTVIDPFVELHSGPGRGYPVFYVIEQGETIEVLATRPGWYEVRSANGRVGWTTSAQLGRTFQATGEPADLPSVGYGDYIKNSWVSGFSAGEVATGELDGYDAFSFNAGYRILNWLEADAEVGRLFGTDITGELYAANVFLEPMSHWRFSPFASLGAGSIKLKSQPKLLQFETENQDFRSYGLGVSYYLGRNFVVKGEYRWYFVSVNNQSDEKLGVWKLGFVTFF